MWTDDYEGNGNAGGNSDGYEGGWEGNSAAYETQARQQWRNLPADVRADCGDLDARRELADTKGITLDGEPAVIVGHRNPFAKVATLRSDGPVAEFAWPTVARIIAKGGAFKS